MTNLLNQQLSIILFALLVSTGDQRTHSTSSFPPKADSFFIAQFSTTAVNVPALPIQITFVGTDDTSDGYSFKFSVMNQSNDQIKELQAYLLAVNDRGDVEYAGYKSNPIDLSGRETKEWAINLGCKLDDNTRVYVVITEVVANISRWKVLKGDDTLDAFARGEAYMLPRVLEAKN